LAAENRQAADHNLAADCGKPATQKYLFSEILT
jgi:hypothetical protein